VKRNDFIANHTEDYENALQDALNQANSCAYFTAFNLSENWRLSYPYKTAKHIGEMNAHELYALLRNLDTMVEDLQKFANYVEEMATAKNELESVDLYEFDDDNGAV
jgi:hypothetical protein